MFRLLGFDVHVRPGFVAFMVLIVFLYGNEFGVWLAGALAGFTLLHELGHAVAARRAGAHAEISLDFLAGYTSYRPTDGAGHELSRSRRAIISAAGPGVHIAVSVAVLVAMGVNPVDRASIGQSDAAVAIWWAGPVIGLFNLVPVLPLDGGHLAQSGLEAVIGGRARRAMLVFSLIATAAFAGWCLLDADRRFYAIFVAFLLVSQMQMLQGSSTRSGRQRAPMDRRLAAAAEAERAAWRTGRSGMLLPGQELSPWYRAHRALLTGRADEARDLIVADLRAPGPRRWWPPDAATPEQLGDLVAVLPYPLPTGNPSSEHVLAEVLLRTGDRVAAGTYAADAFARTRSSASALLVARAAATLGDRAMAVKWLRAAAEAATGVEGGRATLAQAIATAPELAALRDDPEVQRLSAAPG